MLLTCPPISELPFNLSTLGFPLAFTRTLVKACRSLKLNVFSYYKIEISIILIYNFHVYLKEELFGNSEIGANSMIKFCYLTCSRILENKSHFSLQKSHFIFIRAQQVLSYRTLIWESNIKLICDSLYNSNCFQFELIYIYIKCIPKYLQINDKK